MKEIVKTKLETLRLTSGDQLVRPKGCAGNVGFYPKAWIGAYRRRGEIDKTAFLRANPNWTFEDLA